LAGRPHCACDQGVEGVRSLGLHRRRDVALTVGRDQLSIGDEGGGIWPLDWRIPVYRSTVVDAVVDLWSAFAPLQEDEVLICDFWDLPALSAKAWLLERGPAWLVSSHVGAVISTNDE
jgi:hypothetical protein